MNSNQTPLSAAPMQAQDPLAQLRDIHLPEPISWWPPAPGWWVVTILVVAALAFCIVLLIRQRRNNLYRRQALIELENLYSGDTSNSQVFSHQLLALIRRTTISAYPTEKLAQKPTSELLKSISGDAAGSGFNQTLRQQIAELAYKETPEYPDSFATDMYQATKTWLKSHKPMKQESSSC